ncbi:MAG: potassium-transporting ATPase subunit C, partial [Mycobacteriaceae bacterium]|nr:potassium-transporting ATPase subunit C [Mycobacteriaceae bacterium]
MSISSFVRIHWAAFRLLLVLTVITGIGYPLLIWLVAQMPGLHDKANGSMLTLSGKPVASKLIGQNFTDKDGNALPRYFQSRPSAAGTNGYDPTATGASNLGPESIVDTPGDPSKTKDDNGYKASLLTLVCSRSAAVGKLEGVDGSRPFCTGGGLGAVLSVMGPRDSTGNVVHPTKVVSVNEPCEATSTPFLTTYEGVRVECAKFGEDYSIGQIVPIRGAAPANPAVPADAVTASGSGLDPDISVAYADMQIARVAKARGISADQVRKAVG